ncbi:MAG: dipeptide epimerase [Armatimonadetes bacterium]|nr:dipeptide epimerase [Armatimonadota bacterium]MBX3108377.1 dipeptide epimerase [Fimbriimonadaceae bacterium]
MAITFRTFAVDVPKLFPLTISRGTSGTTRNLFVVAAQDGVEGIGEGAPATGLAADFADTAGQTLSPLFEMAQSAEPAEIWAEGHRRGIEPTALAALDCALYDLAAKRAKMPLYRFLGLPLPTAPTSVTIGIEPVAVVLERVPKILAMTQGRALKVKLGSPAGRAHDKEIWDAAREAAEPFGVAMRADANGGWTAQESLDMAEWLNGRGCEYIEQPLVKGAEDQLPDVFRSSALPIYLDESIRSSTDVDRFGDRCHGVNLKLMKSGGISDGLTVLKKARALNLGTMIGCMCETAVGIAQSAAVSGLCDYVDLDTHFNHDPEPGAGVGFSDGVVMPREVPGHGGYLLPGFAQ